ncbi:MAG: sugar ABC transporter ATP-binding protein, partial [Treponema sp.]|nr:sugar ABC transporter ATP-binding protein [Treponema sp.]
MAEPVLSLSGINKSFSGHRVLSNINLSISPGEIFCLAGENGSGKSTLIKIVSGVYTADSGTVTLNGNTYSRLDPVESIKQGVQVIYQDFSIFPNLTVAENISLGTQLAEGRKFINWKQIRVLAGQALRTIGVEMDLDEDVRHLQVAQKQIVAISRAILQNARLIIMDEPTTALTNKEIDRLYEIIRGLSVRKVGIIFVSHKLDEVFAICRRIAVIRNGEIVVDEKAENFAREKLAYYMTGQEIGEVPFVFEPKVTKPILEVTNLNQRGIFKDINFRIFPGEILGITGQLGSGRTELAKALFGIGETNSGSIRIHGEEKRLRNVQDAVANKIAYVPEDRLTEGLLMERSLLDNLSTTTIDRKKNRLGLVKFSMMADEANRRIAELKINAVGIDAKANTFSGGNQQRIVIGKWLASEPEILVLNGPTVGVDVKSKSEIHKILKDLARQGFCI